MVNPTQMSIVPSGRLDERVLDLLAERPGRIAFNGLRRALNVHPESLTRALKRLQREGIVARDRDGYALVAPPDLDRPTVAVDSRTVASVRLPRGTQGEALLGALAGRWFGALRWLGAYERPGDPWLVWSVDGQPGHVLLGILKGQLRVMVDAPRGTPDAPELESAARDLLRHALEELRPSAPANGHPVAEYAAAREPVDWVLN